MDTRLDQKQTELEITRPHWCGRLFNYLVYYKIETGLKDIFFSKENKLVLDMCCGSGIDVEYLAKKGAMVVALDYDAEGIKRTVERAKRYGFKVYPVIGDANNLPFKDDVFFLSFINDGLHHLPNPFKGIDEMCRVSKNKLVIIEPAFSLLTRIAVKFGLSVDFEEHDNNYVYRFREDELKKRVLARGFEKYKTTRYLLWHPHMPFKWFYAFNNIILFSIFIIIFKFTNLLFGWWLGNKISFVAYKKH